MGTSGHGSGTGRRPVHLEAVRLERLTEELLAKVRAGNSRSLVERVAAADADL